MTKKKNNIYNTCDVFATLCATYIADADAEDTVCIAGYENAGEVQLMRAIEIAEDLGYNEIEFTDKLEDAVIKIGEMDEATWEEYKADVTGYVNRDKARMVMEGVIDVALCYGYINEMIINIILSDVELLGESVEIATLLIARRCQEETTIAIDTTSMDEERKSMIASRLHGPADA